MANYDVIVLGVGGMGSAACHALAKRGARVLGLERFRVGHDRGSSHGQTRMIRKAYFEHPNYVPLLKEAYRLWDSLEDESKETLFHKVGLIIYGPEKSQILEGVQRSAKEHSLEIQSLDEKSAARFHRGIQPPEGFRAVLEPGAGFLRVEDCVHQMAKLAIQKGATIHDDEAIVSWRVVGNHVEVMTSQRSYRADKLVVTAGAWSGKVLSDLALPLTVHRNLLHWFGAPDLFHYTKATPCFAFDLPAGFIYGFPKMGEDGIKIANHIPGEVIDDPLQFTASVENQEGKNPLMLEPILRCLAQSFPLVDSTPKRQMACLYTMSPDENFILDIHPEHPQVSFVAGLSGHGFKFAPAIGEVLADFALLGKTAQPVDFLSLKRF